MARNNAPVKGWESKDNKTLLEKSHLRKRMLEHLDAEPCILETHGGVGDIFLRCYPDVQEGAVFETDPTKAVTLLRQRPTWAVYETDSAWALANGVASHLTFNFIDCDPYGGAWDVLEAFFSSNRSFPDRLIVVVHDGLRGRLMRYGGSDISALAHIIEEIGDAQLYPKYLSVCERLLSENAESAGYELGGFGGFYSKQDVCQTHFFAELRK